MPGDASKLLRADEPDGRLRATYLDALLHKAEISRIPFAERQEGVPFGDLYVDRTVVEALRVTPPEPAADADHALHATMMQEAIKPVEINLWQRLQQQHRVVVEAPAWTGKSTLCQWVTQQCLQHPRGWLPIFVRFRDYAQSGKALQSYLDQDYTAWLGLQALRVVTELPDRSQQLLSVGRWLDTLWQAGQALLILDGADEAFVPEQRRRALDALRLSRKLATQPRVLLTSRTVGLSGVVGYEKVVLQELKPPQLMQLVRRCGVLLGAQAQAEQFLAAIQRAENRRVRELATRPGHLVQLVATYVQDGVLLSAEEALMQRVAMQRLAISGRVQPALTPAQPKYTQQVAEAVSFHLLFCRQGQAQSRVQMLALLRHAVREVQANGTPVYTPKDATTLLAELCHNSGFVRPGRRETYAWESVPWLEFFTAAYLARKLAEADAAFTAWVDAKGQSEPATLRCPVCLTSLPPLAHYFWHREWQETLVLLAGLLDDATALLQRIQAEPTDVFDQMTNLAARCLGRAQHVAPEIAEQIDKLVRQAWLDALWTHRPFDVAALQGLVRRRPSQWMVVLGPILRDEYWWVRKAAAGLLVHDHAAFSEMTR